MTGLGATIYLGFFALAALWLYLTADGFGRSAGGAADDQTQRPVFSNSTSASAAAESFSPDLVSHASSK